MGNEKNKEIERFSKALYEMNPEIAEKVIAAANFEIARLKKLRIGEDKLLVFEDHNLKISSKDWEKITVDGEEYKVNPEKDILEITTGDAKGEQLFTWGAAMRETQKAGKRMPTDEEFKELLKTKEDMPNLILAGGRYTNGSFFNRGTNAPLWSSTESGASAWIRNLYSGYSTVYRTTYDKAYGFSVRCLKN